MYQCRLWTNNVSSSGRDHTLKTPIKPWTKDEIRHLRKRWKDLIHIPITARKRMIAEELGRNLGSISGQADYQRLPKGKRGRLKPPTGAKAKAKTSGKTKPTTTVKAKPAKPSTKRRTKPANRSEEHTSD